jgi:hypothetical protein
MFDLHQAHLVNVQKRASDKIINVSVSAASYVTNNLICQEVLHKNYQTRTTLDPEDVCLFGAAVVVSEARETADAVQ